MRRLAAVLLPVGAALLAAALVWPSERMELVSGRGSIPLLDVWLWGRVRSLSSLSSTDLDGSVGTLIVLALAALLALLAGLVWLAATRRSSPGRLRGTIAAVIVVAALAAAGLGLTVLTAGLGFGWYSPGMPVVTRTAVAAFPRLAVGAWAVALVLMVAVLLRRGDGPEAAPGGSADD